MKNRLLFSFTFFFISANVVFSAQEKSERGLFYVKTKHFDIIYASASRESAAHLSQKADALYEEIARMYELKHDFRMPVFLISRDDTFNGYFTVSPFNHIVLYDAPITSDMAVFSDTIVKVFRHELTHAISYNVREGFSRFIQVTFGDAINFGFFIITTAWAEGAAVSNESMYGEGRVNDEYSMHMVKQAKIEGRFPRYSEVNGAKDVYPYTRESYAFGGAFNSWLEEKYGMEKYAEFWKTAVNIKTLSYFGAFKKAYKKPLRDVWQEWKDEIPISDDLRFTHEWSGEALEELSVHSSLSAADGAFCYYDGAKNVVYIRDITKKKYKKVKKINAASVSRTHLSEDGKILSVSYTERGVKRTKNRVKFYDLESGKNFSFKESSVKDAAVFTFEGKRYAVLVKARGQSSALKVYRREGGDFTECTSLEAEEYSSFFSPVGLQDGRVAFIYKKGLSFSIRLFDLKTEQISEIKLPFPRAVIKSLSASGETLAFSWTRAGTMPRAGFIDLASGKLETQRYDISGGVFSPSLASGGTGFYIAHYFDGTKIMKMDKAKMEKEETAITLEYISMPQEEEHAKVLPPLSGEKKFNSFSFLFKKRGTLIPISSLMTYAVDEKALRLQSMSIPLGFTYITSTPWTSPVVSAKGGYSVAHDSGGFGLSVDGVSKTSSLSYGAEAAVLFDKTGYKQSFSSFGGAFSLPLTSSGTLKFKMRDKIALFHGRQSDFSKKFSFDITKEEFSSLISRIRRIHGLYEGDGKERLFVKNSLALGVSSLRSAGRERYEEAGVETNAVWDACVLKNLNGMKSDALTFSNNVGLFSLFSFPRLIPFRNPNGLTLNIPFSLSLSLSPSRAVIADAGVTLTLFSKEIQWSPNFYPVLYVNRFTLEASYTAEFLNRKYNERYVERVKEISTLFTGEVFLLGHYRDYVEVKARLEMTPNLGSFARKDFLFDFDVTVRYSPASGRWSLSIFAINVF